MWCKLIPFSPVLQLYRNRRPILGGNPFEDDFQEQLRERQRARLGRKMSGFLLESTPQQDSVSRMRMRALLPSRSRPVIPAEQESV
ncbi:hypothetical protein GJAV_G00101290 [Gymnothorax javanicus]|nr:hypothetical protein GJAV_G00101290 [Gymnothorax javanicus]